MTLHQVFVIWLACVTNKNTYNAVIANKCGEQQAIATKAGIEDSEVLDFVTRLQELDRQIGVPAERKLTFVEMVGDLFQEFASQPGGYHGPGGEACGKLEEIMGAIGEP